MMSNATNQRPVVRDRALDEGRRVLDLAEGILIGLRRYPTGAAFEELLSVAHRHDTSVSAVAAGLVAMVTGDHNAAESNPAAAYVAQREWGDLLAGKIQP
jgi:hypothetical protein